MRRSYHLRRLSRGFFGEIVEEPTESPAPWDEEDEHENEEEEDDEENEESAEVYLAVDRCGKEGKKNLSWVLGNTSMEKKIVVVHVHLPPQKVPVLGGWFPANQASQQQVADYKKVERRMIEQQLDEYINMCTSKSRRAEKLVINGDDVGKVLVELITQYGITELVFGAAEPKKLFSRDSKAQMSVSALIVQQQADPSCDIKFVSQGNLNSTRPKNKGTTSTKGFKEFSHLQMKHATRDFLISLKIGEGGFGSVHRGLLHRKEVAIKMLKPENISHGEEQFHKEVSVLSKLRHPNLVKLVGTCPEKYGIVYEFLHNGSLQDHLTCKNKTPALTWQSRARIAAEICSALVFLHSHCIAHGDLKPENVLLDRNLVSKLSDFGLCQLLVHSNTLSTLYYQADNPGGTPGYMDPQILYTLQFTRKCDMYSFGVILLRLLTGKSPFGIIQVVQDALEMEVLNNIVDPSAGQWPYVHAKMLAELGLRCCETERENRPSATDAFLVLERWLMFASSGENSRIIPSRFICPVLQEIMKDPYTAADGYNYEARAINLWLSRGINISPVTGLELPNLTTLQNVRLRDAIQKWRVKNI